jgi:hypothetical protein
MPANNSPRFVMRLEQHEKDRLQAIADGMGIKMAELVRPCVLKVLELEPMPPRPRGRVPRVKTQ